MSSGAGIPLLSGPPPPSAAGEACRKCNKEFNIFLNRQKQCNHCGYYYCSSCTDYVALMPRENGYDNKPVCSFCIDLLTMTASGKGILKSFPMSKLKNYITAYNIRMDRAVEKEDLVNAIVAARGPNGCLSRSHEDYYRKHSVPDRTTHTRPRGVFSSSRPPQPNPPAQDHRRTNVNNGYGAFARPDLEPEPPHYAPPPGPPPNSRPPPRQSYPPHTSASSASASSHSTPNSSGQRSSSANSGYHYAPPPHSPPRASAPPPSSQTRSPPPPPPDLDRLISMSEDEISHLPVSALKSILFTNHVNTGVGVLEKSELVSKVKTLVENERRERERRDAEEMLERQRDEARRAEREEELRREQEEINQAIQDSMNDNHQHDHHQHHSGPIYSGDEDHATEPPFSPSPTPGEERTTPDAVPSSSSPPPHSAPPSNSTSKAQSKAMQEHLERTGLCVICQDEEANIAIVDCGHLCLCRGCSDIVMANTRECPLCRTRIVTESRLLRIFKT